MVHDYLGYGYVWARYVTDTTDVLSVCMIRPFVSYKEMALPKLYSWAINDGLPKMTSGEHGRICLMVQRRLEGHQDRGPVKK
jgi:hypothetical protein